MGEDAAVSLSHPRAKYLTNGEGRKGGIAFSRRKRAIGRQDTVAREPSARAKGKEDSRGVGLEGESDGEDDEAADHDVEGRLPAFLLVLLAGLDAEQPAGRGVVLELAAAGTGGGRREGAAGGGRGRGGGGGPLHHAGCAGAAAGAEEGGHGDKGEASGLPKGSWDEENRMSGLNWAGLGSRGRSSSPVEWRFDVAESEVCVWRT